VFGNRGVLPADVDTLAEQLKAHGYRTVARMANPVIGASTGLAQGFDDV
jgi:arylsulfatase A-like enzyme